MYNSLFLFSQSRQFFQLSFWPRHKLWTVGPKQWQLRKEFNFPTLMLRKSQRKHKKDNLDSKKQMLRGGGIHLGTAPLNQSLVWQTFCIIEHWNEPKQDLARARELHTRGTECNKPRWRSGHSSRGRSIPITAGSHTGVQSCCTNQPPAGGNRGKPGSTDPSAFLFSISCHDKAASFLSPGETEMPLRWLTGLVCSAKAIWF